jgi:hypothetical protein
MAKTYTNKEMALIYNKKYNWNVFPVKQDKTPYFKWEDLQTQKVTPKMIEDWWKKYPDANIALATGAISNVAVIDLDAYKDKKGVVEQELSKYVPHETGYAIATTPRGGIHYYFTCKDTKIGNNTDKPHNVDLRANGGYIILPPSSNGNGKRYKWAKAPSQVKMDELPKPYLDMIAKSVSKRIQTLQDVSRIFNSGRRDEDLFHVAHCLIKGGMIPEIAFKVLERIVSTWKEPEGVDIKKWIADKVFSAVQRAEKKDHHWKEEVENWVTYQEGYWKVSECNNALQAVSKDEKSGVRTAIRRLVQNKIIIHHPSQAGVYRKIDKEAPIIDYMNASGEALGIKLPFQLEDYCLVYPKSIVLVAGEPNAGKSAFMLNVVELNMDKFKTFYFSSEINDHRLKVRLSEFDRALNSWTFEPREKCENFADVIEPEGLNIIDYMEIHENHYLIGRWLKEVFDKLTTGVAVIAVQRKKGEGYGVGGMATLQKPELVLNIGSGEAEIIKCKSFAIPTVNPNGWKIGYKLVSGCKFFMEQTWGEANK